MGESPSCGLACGLETGGEINANIELAQLKARLNHLEAEVYAIRCRNLRVEADKGWVTSRIRLSFIAIATFLVTSLVFLLIGVPNYLLNACVPTIAYCVSAQSLSFIRKFRLESRAKGLNHRSNCEPIA